MAGQHEPDTIGERLHRLRGEHGLTQEALAALAGLSVDLVKKLEQGKRQSARLTTIAALANALDVPMSELTDKRPRLDGAGDRLVLALRDTLLSPDLLVGVDPADDGEPTPLAELAAAVDRAWADYWAGRFVELARTVPALIAEARLAHRLLGVTVSRALAEAYEIAACLLVHLGREDLAAVSAERGIAAAAGGEDELLWAVLHGSYAWALIGQARHREAEQVAIRVPTRCDSVPGGHGRRSRGRVLHTAPPAIACGECAWVSGRLAVSSGIRMAEGTDISVWSIAVCGVCCVGLPG